MMARFLLLALSVFSLAACSLTYKEEEPQVGHIPELVFTEVEYLSYEDGRVRMQMGSAQLEQYRDDGAFYGEDVSFFSFDKEGRLDAEGHSDIISANTSSDTYILLGNVSIQSHKEGILLRGNFLQWDGVGEQLMTGMDDSLDIIRDTSMLPEREEGEGTGKASRINMSGTGFSASGVSMSFQFQGPVSGTIYTRKREASTK